MPRVENLYTRVDRVGSGTIKARYKPLLIDLYRKTLMNRDDLPYSREFNALYREFRKVTGEVVSLRSLWVAYRSLGKNGDLPKEAEKIAHHRASKGGS